MDNSKANKKKEKSPIDEKIGSIVAALRKSKGITQAELAERIGASQDTISKLEKGDIEFTISRTYKIAEALGVEIKTIILSDVDFVDLNILNNLEKEKELYRRELNLLYKELANMITSIYFNTIWINLTPVEQKEATVNGHFNPLLGASLIKTRKDEQTTIEIFGSITTQMIENISKLLQERINPEK